MGCTSNLQYNYLLFSVRIVKIMELIPFKSITGSDTFWDGSIPNPLSVGIPISVSRITQRWSSDIIHNRTTGREQVWVTEDTMGIPTMVIDLFGTRSEVRWFLSPATEVSGVIRETEIGIPTLRGLGMEPSQKVSLE
jgi:hypothetical protein